MLLNLFLEFFKIGLFAIGGGLATFPFLYDLSTKSFNNLLLSCSYYFHTFMNNYPCKEKENN